MSLCRRYVNSLKKSFSIFLNRIPTQGLHLKSNDYPKHTDNRCLTWSTGNLPCKLPFPAVFAASFPPGADSPPWQPLLFLISPRLPPVLDAQFPVGADCTRGASWNDHQDWSVLLPFGPSILEQPVFVFYERSVTQEVFVRARGLQLCLVAITARFRHSHPRLAFLQAFASDYQHLVQIVSFRPIQVPLLELK